MTLRLPPVFSMKVTAAVACPRKSCGAKFGAMRSMPSDQSRRAVDGVDAALRRRAVAGAAPGGHFHLQAPALPAADLQVRRLPQHHKIRAQPFLLDQDAQRQALARLLLRDADDVQRAGQRRPASISALRAVHHGRQRALHVARARARRSPRQSISPPNGSRAQADRSPTPTVSMWPSYSSLGRPSGFRCARPRCPRGRCALRRSPAAHLLGDAMGHVPFVVREAGRADQVLQKSGQCRSWLLSTESIHGDCAPCLKLGWTRWTTNAELRQSDAVHDGCLVRAVAEQHARDRCARMIIVSSTRRPVLDVVDVQQDHLVEGQLAAAADLPQPGQCRAQISRRLRCHSWYCSTSLGSGGRGPTRLISPRSTL